MIIVLHGDNQVASRNRFKELKLDFEGKGWQVIALDGKTADFNQIKITAASGSLLGEGMAVFIEELWSRKRTPAATRELQGNIIFWEPKQLPAVLTGSFPKEWTIESFVIPRSVFRFLESLSPSSILAFRILGEVLKNESPEMVLPLLAWHTRQLIWAKIDPETLTIPMWKKGKLVAQSKLFKIEELYKLHHKILALDRSQKTGVTLSLPVSLDLLLAGL